MILILYLVKASVVISVAAGTLVLVGRKSSAALRHLICTLAIAGLLALPILSAVVPAWSFTIAAGPANHFPQGYGGPPEPSAKEEAGHDVLPARLAGGPANHLRQAYGGPPKPSAKEEAGHVLPAFPWQLVALVIYGTGVLLLMARLLFDWLSARRLARDTPELNDPAVADADERMRPRVGSQRPRAAAAQPGAGHAHGDRHPPSSHRRPRCG